MVTQEQFVNGMINYVDNEVIPKLPTIGKWGLGSIIVLTSSKTNEIVNLLTSNPIVATIGLVDENGRIYSDRLFTALKTSAQKYGNLVINIPVIGTLSFSADDVDKARMYVDGGAGQ